MAPQTPTQEAPWLRPKYQEPDTSRSPTHASARPRPRCACDALPSAFVYAVRTRRRKVRAGALEVRWDEGGLVCWVDGRWHPVGALVPTETQVEEC